MALAAAAMAQVMCMEMMRRAQETGDQMMMMMAMQMCAQAAQNAANAAQNKSGASKMTTAPQMPNANSFPIKEANIDTKPQNDSFDLNNLLNAGKNTGTEIKLADPAKVDFSSGNPTDSKLDVASTSNQDTNDSKDNNNPLPLAEQNGAQSNAVTLGQTPSNGGGMGGMMNPNAAAYSANNKLDLASKTPSPENPEDNFKKAVKRPAGTKGSDEGSSESGNNSAFDDFMSRMGGGAAPNGIASAGLGSGGFMDLAQGLKQGTQSVNIFEFASLQYQKAKASGLGQLSKKLPPARNLASE